MLSPAFKINTNQQIQQNLITIGKYDGIHPQLTCTTPESKIFQTSPHINGGELQWLNINKEITSITTGNFNDKDILIVGSSSSISAYNIIDNSDLFQKDLDGVQCLLYSNNFQPNKQSPLIFVGSTCSITGLDFKGIERQWQATNDTVTSMTLGQGFSDIGDVNLIFGCVDGNIVGLLDKENIFDFHEQDAILSLVSLNNKKIGQGLNNYNIGVYNIGIGGQPKRLWRSKSKNLPTTLLSINIDDGTDALMAGYKNGKIEVRSDVNGELIWKSNICNPVAKLLSHDLRMDGTNQILAISTEGNVHGYLLAEKDISESSSGVFSHAISKLAQRRHTVAADLERIQRQFKEQQNIDIDNQQYIPKQTTVDLEISINPDFEKGLMNMHINISSGVIRSIIIIGDNIIPDFEQDTIQSIYCIHLTESTKSKIIPLKLIKNRETEIKIKVLVGTSIGIKYLEVIEKDYIFPSFSMFALVQKDEDAVKPEGYIKFLINERVNRVAMWIENNFLISEQNKNYLKKKSKILQAKFINLTDNTVIIISMNFDDKSNKQQVLIQCDYIELIGSLIQDMCSYLNITELETEASFPQEMKHLSEHLEKVIQFNQARSNISINMAESVSMVKQLLISAEDLTNNNNFDDLKDIYNNLWNVNGELITEFNKRTSNHIELVKNLKNINQMIQKAANLRVGSARQRVITLCRQAIKNNNIHALINIIQRSKE